MRLPRKVYVIYPFDDSGEIAGAYVGSSWHINVRIKSHVWKNTTPPHKEFHELMKKNGFAWQELDEILVFSEKHKEYDWIAFFKSQKIRVFNTFLGKEADPTKIYRNGNAPIWTGEKVIWGNE